MRRIRRAKQCYSLEIFLATSAAFAASMISDPERSTHFANSGRCDSDNDATSIFRCPLHCLSRKDSVAGPKYGLLIAITFSEIALTAHLVRRQAANARRPSGRFSSTFPASEGKGGGNFNAILCSRIAQID